MPSTVNCELLSSPMTSSSRKRPETVFAFGMFGIEGGFAVSHQYDRTPGIIRPADPVTLRVDTVPEYESVTAFVVDGSGPFTAQSIRDEGLEIPFTRSGNDWLATIFGKLDGTTSHYIIEALHRSGARHYGDGRLPLANARVFTHRTTSRRPPAWTQNAVVYQIFVDRFANAHGMVEAPESDYDWAGGDLHGVTANLEWLSSLGVNCIWLTPVFTCHSYHGYDTVDMKSIDDRFGGDEALRTLITAAHERGIRILLDLVPNHISHRHPWFVNALNGGPERDWFFLEDDDSYLMFFTSETMPKVNLEHPDAREAMLDVAAYWVKEFGVDGYRIDHLPATNQDKIRNRHFGMIFQSYHLLPELTTLENVLSPAMISQGIFSYISQRKKNRQRAELLLQKVGLSDRAKHKPRELSGGEMQRAAIARALFAQPRVLLADEPTGNLDRATGEQVMKILRELNQTDNLTIVMVTHDTNIAKQADRVVHLAEGRIQSA
jgi:ABC-type lipoprotein export system ATPase subunit